jgi:hypothetical protein
MTKKIVTLHDARREKWAMDAKQAAKYAKADALLAQRAADAAFAQAHPQIGQLIRNGAPLYYVNAPAYRESRNPRALVEG